MDYHEFIKQCPELGDILAEYENRISYLENLNAPPFGDYPQLEETATEEQPRLWYRQLQQLKAQVQFNTNKLMEKRVAKKKGYKYE